MKNNKYKIGYLLIALVTCISSFAQQPPYTPKLLRTTWAPGIVKIDTPENGIGRTYAITEATLWDVDNNNATHIKWNYKILITMEGPYKNGKREGIFVYRVVDSLNPAKTYPIYEQTFKNDQLNGEKKLYYLPSDPEDRQETVISVYNYLNGEVEGKFTEYYPKLKKNLIKLKAKQIEYFRFK